ncbi:hypothetical protein OH77DRAFT_1421664 [Trametes cingulata]|nr:hypothetical protein OH77DRAFT_1421664 [Trametes cingulata]
MLQRVELGPGLGPHFASRANEWTMQTEVPACVLALLSSMTPHPTRRRVDTRPSLRVQCVSQYSPYALPPPAIASLLPTPRSRARVVCIGLHSSARGHDRDCRRFVRHVREVSIKSIPIPCLIRSEDTDARCVDCRSDPGPTVVQHLVTVTGSSILVHQCLLHCNCMVRLPLDKTDVGNLEGAASQHPNHPPHEARHVEVPDNATVSTHDVRGTRDQVRQAKTPGRTRQSRPEVLH